MKRLSILAATAAMLALTGPARAQQLDLAAMTCKEFSQATSRRSR